MALAVIVLSPLFDDDFGLLERVEDFAVEQFIPEAGFEALAVIVLPRSAQSIPFCLTPTEAPAKPQKRQWPARASHKSP